MLFGYPAGKPHSIISSILSSGLLVYLAAIKSGRFLFLDLVLESGHLCPKCGTADCAKYHGTWYRKIILDLCSGESFTNVPILRAIFCDGSTISLFPAELWRGKTTITSALGVVSIALKEGLEGAMQWVCDCNGGEEVISERTLRRLIRRSGSRFSVAAKALNFFQSTAKTFSEKFENFLTSLHRRDLVILRSQWGYSILDIPRSIKAPDCSSYPQPGIGQPHPAQNPPSEILPRGTWSAPYRRGRPPDE